jgi:hypothetical protein
MVASRMVDSDESSNDNGESLNVSDEYFLRMVSFDFPHFLVGGCCAVKSESRCFHHVQKVLVLQIQLKIVHSERNTR